MKKIVLIVVLVIVAIFIYPSLKTKEVKENPPAENVGNSLEKNNLIRLQTPKPNDVVQSPLVLKGEARGNWFFEASFPIFVTDWDGLIIGEGYATADGEWMTTEFVPFTATINFTVAENIYSKKGTLILKKDNPSGLPEHDDALEIPILFN